MKIAKSFIILAMIFTAAFGFTQEYNEYDYSAEIEETPDQGITVAEETDLIDLTELAVEETADTAETAEPTETVEAVPGAILNNQYFLESVRLNQLAREAYIIGDYDASTAYAEQAAEAATLSDIYVAMRLAETAYYRAHSRYTWAGSVGAADRYPSEYETATTAYGEAQEARSNEDWDTTLAAANRVLDALFNIRGLGNDTGPQPSGPFVGRQQPGSLPAQYTVRLWVNTGDSFSTIAGWSWVYGDPGQWRVLYEANRHKLPNPNNPHLIMPGMIMDIPSLRGETRSGMWDPSAEY